MTDVIIKLSIRPVNERGQAVAQKKSAIQCLDLSKQTTITPPPERDRRIKQSPYTFLKLDQHPEYSGYASAAPVTFPNKTQ